MKAPLGPRPLKTVVTHLEMKERPHAYAPLPLNRKIALIKADNIPLHFYRYLMYRTGKRWHWVMRLRMSDAELASIVHAPTTDIFVLSVDGAPAGFFEIERKDPEIGEISYFGLMDHAIGTGLGRWFLSAAIESAWRHDPKKVIVHTCTLDHPAALGLYQKLGFSPAARGEAVLLPLSDEDHLRLAKLD